MKKKVVVFIPTLQTGGAEKLALDLVSKIDREKFETILVSLFPKKNTIYEEIAEKRGVRVVYLNKKPGPDMFTFLSVWKLLNSIKPDIVHTHIYASSYVYPWMVFHRKVNWVHTVHSIASKELYSFHKLLMKRIYYKYPKFNPIAISEEVKKSIIEEYHVNSDSIVTIYNGIDLSEFTPKLQKNRQPDIEFICVARFNDVKNHRMLVDGFKKYTLENSQARLTLVGDGELKPEIINLVHELGIKESVHFVGQTSDVQSYLSKADVFVLTSKYEGLPLSVLEAMSVGLPIIATDVGGISDVIRQEENGLLIQSNDVEGLCRAMCLMTKNNILIEKIKKQNIKDAHKYDLKQTTKRYEQIYNT